MSRYVLFSLLLLFPIVGFAQYKYTVTGTITDSQTNEALPGCSIYFLKSGKGISSDVDGQFKISGIRSNDKKLAVSFLGYKVDTLTLKFASERNIKFDIKLKPSSKEIDEIAVRAIAEGQVKAALEQKRAENIKNIVSAEQIEQFPDLNAGEAMQRIPGITLQRDQGEGRYVQLRGTPPEYTNFNVNGEQIPSPEGDVRYVGMDIISADQIDQIEVTKVLTPEMDGDAIGGTVNITTKKATSEIPEIKATLAGGYSELRKTNNYQLNFSYAQRHKGFGFLVNASQFENEYGSENMEFEYVKKPFFGSQEDGEDNYYVQFEDAQLRYYDITRKRTGLSATLDYEFNPNSFIYIRGMYNNFSDYEVRKRKKYTLDDALSETTYLYGGIEHDVKEREKLQNLNTINLGGEHKTDFFTIDYEASYSKASEEQPDRLEATFENPGQAIEIKFDMSNKDYPRPWFSDPDNAENAYNYDEYELDELLFSKINVTDKNYSGKLNLEIPYSFDGNNQGYFKVGGKIRTKEKSRDLNAQVLGKYATSSFLYPGEAPELSLTTVNDGFYVSDFLNQGYVLEYMPSPSMLRDIYEFYPQFFIFDRDEIRNESYLTDYKATEDVYGAYAMVSHNIGNLMLLGGLRFEKTDVWYEVYNAIRDSYDNFIGIDTVQQNKAHEFLLPNLQLKYKIDENTNIRAAFTNTFTRPNFNDLLPIEDTDDDEITRGNDSLSYPTSMNFDFLIEKYLASNGIISGGLFYKNIDGFIFYHKERESAGSFGGGATKIITPKNGDKAKVFGAELQSQFKFSFLPGFAENFGMYLNYTYTYSEAKIDLRMPGNYHGTVSDTTVAETIPLPGQSKHSGNLALFYDSKSLYIKLAANIHDPFLYRIGEISDFDEYYDKSFHLDFNASVFITDNFTIFTDVRNITNEPLRMYIKDEERIQKIEYYSWSARLGLKLQF